MPHYKCETCKARLRVGGAPNEQVLELCPGCGSLLEPVTELADLVGLRVIQPLELDDRDAPIAAAVAVAPPRPPAHGPGR
jgi:hypothetical protein